MKKKSCFIIIMLLILSVCLYIKIARNENENKVLCEIESLSQKERLQLIRLQEIADMLLSENLFVQEFDGTFKVVNQNGEGPGFYSSRITKQEMDYITGIVQRYSMEEKVSHERMYQDVKKAILEKPNQDIYRVEYDTGVWLEIGCELEKVDDKSNTTENKLLQTEDFDNATYPNEIVLFEEGKDVKTDGVYKFVLQQKLFAGLYYVENCTTVFAEFSNGCNDVEIINVDSKNDYLGLIDIDLAETHKVISNWNYSQNEGLYCEGVNVLRYTMPSCIQAISSHPYTNRVATNHSWVIYNAIRIAGQGFGVYLGYDMGLQ